jgi:uracil DNA glycosylase
VPPSLRNVSLFQQNLLEVSKLSFRSTPKSKQSSLNSNRQSMGENRILCILHSPKHCECRNLSAWADDGVLMLNTCLTVRAGAAGSHSNRGWEQFTDTVVDVVDKYGGANLGGPLASGLGRGVVFLAWGAWAAKRVAKLNKVCHLL